MKKKYKYFIIEADEILDELTKDLLALEKHAHDPSQIDTIFRKIHKLKGAAGVVGLTAFSGLTHQLEDRLVWLRNHKEPVLPAQITPLLDAVDTLAKMLAAIKAGRPENAIKDSAVSSELKAVPSGTSAAESIRIKASDLEYLSRLSNEIHINSGRLKNLAAVLPGMSTHNQRTLGRITAAQVQPSGPNKDSWSQMAQTIDTLSRHIENTADLVLEMNTVIASMRLIPIKTFAHLFEKATRDIAAKTGKSVDFTMQGDGLYLDRALLDRIREPILQLLRNSVIHGIEDADERKKAGKTATARVRLTFSRNLGRLQVSCHDDGRGLDAQTITAKAVHINLVDPEDAACLSEEEAFYLILRSGFSLAKSVSELAGRGIGLDIVNNCVTSIGGSLSIASKKGRFTCFILSLPLQVDILSVFAVRVAGQTLLLPLKNVLETRLVPQEQIALEGGRPKIQLNGAPIALVPLADILEIDTQFDTQLGTQLGTQVGSRKPMPEKLRAIIVQTAIGTVAFWVSSLEGAMQIVPHPLEGSLKKNRHLQASTILADGKPALVLELTSLVEKAGTFAPPKKIQVIERPGPAVMVVDDSESSRQLIEGILKAAGYRVAVAGSGRMALEILETETIDIFVIDIEMPGMDGFELSQAVRCNDDYKQAPIIILSTRGSDTDKRRGMDAGANAYIVKGVFDQHEFLWTVASFASP